MDLKLIEKLARLANNNPNEHEANAAARKVCKLLQEDNFKFFSDPDSDIDELLKSTMKATDDLFNDTYSYFTHKANFTRKTKGPGPNFHPIFRTCIKCGMTEAEFQNNRYCSKCYY